MIEGVWTPKTIKPRMKVKHYQCAKCHGAHATFWLTSTVRPPSCKEQK